MGKKENEKQQPKEDPFKPGRANRIKNWEAHKKHLDNKRGKK